MDTGLEGKRALVTGSSSGIGTAIAEMLSAEGVSVVVHGRDEDRTHAAAEGIRKAGGKAVAAVGDLITAEGAQAVIDATLAAVGGIDILVNNAGGPIKPNSQSWFDLTPDDWAETFANNTISSVRLIHAFVPAMRERRWGRVIQVSSRNAIAPHASLCAYAASKAGVNNMVVSLARELAHSGVTANGVMPGLIYTPMLDSWLLGIAKKRGWGDDIEKAKALVIEEGGRQSMARLGMPSDIAAYVCYLASPLSEFVNGTVLTVDGGP